MPKYDCKFEEMDSYNLDSYREKLGKGYFKIKDVILEMYKNLEAATEHPSELSKIEESAVRIFLEAMESEINFADDLFSNC